MFYITTFLKNPLQKITNLDEIKFNTEKYFVDINNSKRIVEFLSILDFDYLDGAILIRYNDEIIMDSTLWDLIDQLWSYILNLIQEFINTGEAETFFPDQPVKIKLKKITKSTVLFSVYNNSWQFDTNSFIKSLLDGAEVFFDKMAIYNINEENYYKDELLRIMLLKKVL